MALLTPIWINKSETARRVHHRIGTVLKMRPWRRVIEATALIKTTEAARQELPAGIWVTFANENEQNYFPDHGTQTTNLASISKKKVVAFPLPVPPVDEALEIA